MPWKCASSRAPPTVICAGGFCAGCFLPPLGQRHALNTNRRYLNITAPTGGSTTSRPASCRTFGTNFRRCRPGQRESPIEGGAHSYAQGSLFRPLRCSTAGPRWGHCSSRRMGSRHMGSRRLPEAEASERRKARRLERNTKGRRGSGCTLLLDKAIDAPALVQLGLPPCNGRGNETCFAAKPSDPQQCPATTGRGCLSEPEYVQPQDCLTVRGPNDRHECIPLPKGWGTPTSMRSAMRPNRGSAVASPILHMKTKRQSRSMWLQSPARGCGDNCRPCMRAVAVDTRALACEWLTSRHLCGRRKRWQGASRHKHPAPHAGDPGAIGQSDHGANRCPCDRRVTHSRGRLQGTPRGLDRHRKESCDLEGPSELCFA